ncbi:MAG: helix-turn-helix domain-containing protein [Clostridia bacterium]|nr:helix-turn-helix domain-containing protein [Clostridia bacterium]
MEKVKLIDLITYLEYGTKLQIGVLFFGKFTNTLLSIPKEKQTHTKPICEFIKSTANGYKRCFRCKTLAYDKALKTKTPFGGHCIHGLYEYVYPIVEDGVVIAIIFVGNIYIENKKLTNKINNTLISTAEANFGPEKCKTICRILEEYIKTAIKEEEIESDGNSVVKNIKKYILSNLAFPIKLSDIAQKFHYNEKYLGRLFKQKAGKSINEYIIEQRLYIAEEKLKTTQDSILNIAVSSGFLEVTYFNRIFKKKHGCTPSQYRKSIKKRG